MSSRLIGWSAVVLILALCAEILSFATFALAPQLERYIYRVPDVSAADYANYLENRNPVLGWPGADWLDEFADDRGARKSPANAELGDTAPCASVYGDSFALGADVDDRAAWANVMAADLGCRVDNYGVGGFGTGQALLRLEAHLKEGRDLGPVLILTMYPDNLNRNVNQWRYLLTRSSPLTFKPAFHVGRDGTVQLEPIFDGDFEAFERLVRDPGDFLPAETYAPGMPGFGRLTKVGFPYALSMANILLDTVPSFRGFGDSGRYNFYNYPIYYDTSDGLSDDKKAVAAHILGRFAKLCAEYGKTCAFVITPDPELVLQRADNGKHDLADWLAEISNGLIFLDGTEIFTDLDDICSHVTYPNNCNGHYSPAGYARLARFVREGLAGHWPE